MERQKLKDIEHTNIVIDWSQYDLDVCDLIYYDGPFLSLAVDKDNVWYFVYWCDMDDNNHRWQLIRTNEQIIDDYINKRITLKDAFEKCDDYVVIFDTYVEHSDANVLGNLIVQTYGKVMKSSLPNDYIPHTNTIYKFDIEHISDGYILETDKNGGKHIIKETGNED